MPNSAYGHKCRRGRGRAGTWERTVNVIHRLPVAMGVTSDELVFGRDARRPDEDLRLQFQSVSQFAPDEKKAPKEVLDALFHKHQARRWTGTG